MGYPPGTPISSRPSLTGPVILITIGVIFLMEEFIPQWGISRTWPILLIVIGVLKLIDSAMPPRPPQGPRV
jgi:membrane-bound ClpP family serine protease